MEDSIQNIGNYYSFLGAIIGSAVEDFRKYHKIYPKLEKEWHILNKDFQTKCKKLKTPEKRYRLTEISLMLYEYETAKRFIFGKGLRSWVETCVPELDISSVQDFCKKPYREDEEDVKFTKGL